MTLDPVVFAYASDLHLAHFPEGWYPDLQVPQSADALLLAGDVFDGTKSSMFDWLLKQTEGLPVFLTLGNHELYGTRRDKSERVLKDAFKGTHVQVLLNDSALFKGVRVLGTDLWTDFCFYGEHDKPRAMHDAEDRYTGMTDYRNTTFKDTHGRFRQLRARDTLNWHNQARLFVEQELKHSGEPVVLMSHHAPFHESVSGLFEKSTMNGCFASDLSDSFNRGGRWPSACVHGHVHEASRYQKGDHKTWVLNNPHGYYRCENQTGYRDNALFAVNPETGDVTFPDGY